MTAPNGIDGLQGVDGPHAVTKLSVVIVLDEVCASTIGPGEQLVSAPDRHDCAQGELVRRRHVREAYAPVGRKPVGHDAMVVDGDIEQRGAGRLERKPGHPVARVLDDDVVARVDQHSRTQVDALLRSMHDHDLVRIADQPAGAPKVSSKLRAQFGLTLRIGIGKPGLPFQKRLAIGLSPRECREIGACQRTVQEVHRRALGVERSRNREPVHTPAKGRQCSRFMAGLVLLARCSKRWGDARRNTCPGSRRGFKVALGSQLLVDRGHGGTRDADFCSERTRGRQPRTGRKGAISDLRPELLVDALTRLHPALRRRPASAIVVH